jgi:hypothetical protein
LARHQPKKKAAWEHYKSDKKRSQERAQRESLLELDDSVTPLTLSSFPCALEFVEGHRHYFRRPLTDSC